MAYNDIIVKLYAFN